MPMIFWDIETRSALDLEAAGSWRYAADPMTEVLCIASQSMTPTPKLDAGGTNPGSFHHRRQRSQLARRRS